MFCTVCGQLSVVGYDGVSFDPVHCLVWHITPTCVLQQTAVEASAWQGTDVLVFATNMHACLSVPCAESDSANLDHMAELLVRTGMEPQEALMLLVPEAFRNHPDLMKEYPEVVDFYEFYEGLQEGWDGPALLVFSDGRRIGARLDRNGLRPARFWRTADDTIYVASEVGGCADAAVDRV